MDGAREAFLGLFKLMKAKGLLNAEELKSLDDSMHGTTPEPFIDTIERICKEGETC
jgi:hypothetical protein